MSYNIPVSNRRWTEGGEKMKEEIKKILMAHLQLCYEKSKSEPYGDSLAELSNAVAELAHAYYLFDV